METAPDSTGPKPEDWAWSATNWLGFTLIAEGDSQRKVAERLGLSAGTVSTWVRRWRKAYGDDLFRSEAQANITASRQHLGSPENIDRVQGDWGSLRAATAAVFGEGAAATMQLFNQTVDELLEDPARRALMTPRDLASMATAIYRLVKIADELIDDNRAGSGSGGFDSENLSRLEGHAEITQVTTQMTVLLADFKKQQAAANLS